MDIDSLLDELESEYDWPKEATSIREVEKSLSCAICHGIMKAAVMLSKCGHSFCSFCIRQYLYKEQLCPLCRKPATESDIIRNITVIEIADIFKENRQSLISLCQRLYSPKPSTSSLFPEGECNRPKQTVQECERKEDLSQKRELSTNTISILSSDSDSVFEEFTITHRDYP